ncbi:Obg-like ATPase [Spathaspora sp. JA1]|nr:Obg-like ATPase [Spathaspora sp. JA1]
MIRHFSTSLTRLAKPTTTAAPPLYLGRPSNNLSSGLVGLANIGKSTFFQAFTNSKLSNPANYPYATIEPCKSIVSAKSDVLEHYQSIFGSEKQIQSKLTIWDIAGLTRGASSGAGLGNQFLNDIRQVDGVFQVIRGFIDDDITHVEKTVDPVRDCIVVGDELILKDLEFIENERKILQREKKHKKNENIEWCGQVLDKLENMLYEGIKVINGEYNEEEIKYINGLNLLTAKPTVYLLNTSAEDYGSGNNQFIKPVSDWIVENSPNDKLIVCSGEYETQLNELTGEELAQYVANIGQGKPSAINDIVSAMKSALHLISFYTCGPKEAHQWSLRQGKNVTEAAGVIHTDLQQTFINSIVYKWKDLQELTAFDEGKLKSQGKQYRHGKKYIVEDGDVIIIKAGSGKK